MHNFMKSHDKAVTFISVPVDCSDSWDEGGTRSVWLWVLELFNWKI